MRLDKFFSEQGILSRSEVKKALSHKNILVNGVVARKGEMQIDPACDEIIYLGRRVAYEPLVYYVMHKPAGVITATEDAKHTTVMDVFRTQVPGEGRELFPVGRLDLDTEGLLLLTNDGALSHALLSPNRHVEKTYVAVVTGKLQENAVDEFAAGMEIGEKKPTKPAALRILHSNLGQMTAEGRLTFTAEEMEHLAKYCPMCEEGNDWDSPVSVAEVTLTEGKFHQVKRMFAAVGTQVVYLKRTQFGNLMLTDELPCGAVKKITAADIVKET